MTEVRLLIVIVVAACDFQPGMFTTVDGDSAGDADHIDGTLDTLSPSCHGSGNFMVCLDQPPSGSKDLSGPIDTSVGSPECAGLVAPGRTDVCVVAGQALNVQSGNVVSGSGARPLVLVATDTIRLFPDAVLEVSSRRGGPTGAAANSSLCATDGVAPGTRGGGYGGSFGARGGNGGGGANGGAGGTSPSTSDSTTLRGGCAGGSGASGGSGGGDGGGAVQLVAATIQLDAGSLINASGAGAFGAASTSKGAGGGGSGGMVVLEATTVIGAGVILSRGGGGGEGSDGSAGADGADPDPLALSTAASGGSGSSNGGGNGGNGSQASAGGDGLDGTFTSGNPGGGGGGGGGAGVVRIIGASAGFTGTASPPPI